MFIVYLQLTGTLQQWDHLPILGWHQRQVQIGNCMKDCSRILLLISPSCIQGRIEWGGLACKVPLELSYPLTAYF